MPELRIDPLTGQRALDRRRARRTARRGPQRHAGRALDPERDPFAEGHEDRTPPELYAVRPGGGAPDTPGWTVRVVPNLYPALEPDAEHRPPTPTPSCSGRARPAAPTR